MKKKIKENLGDDATHMEIDHEVQMARAQLYHLTNDAIKLHKILKNISEEQGLEGWVQGKITLAADYIKSVVNYMEYNSMEQPTVTSKPPVMPESSTTSSGSIATAVRPMGKMRRR